MADFNYKIIAEIEEEICPLAEVKAFLRVTTNEDDDLISNLTEAAIDAAEKYTRLNIKKRKLAAFSEFCPNNIIRLNHTPINVIEEIRLKLGQDIQELGVENYELLDFERVKFAPALRLKDLTITYIAGGIIPAAVKQGILVHIAEMYDQQNLSFGLIEAVRDLYQPYRKIIL